MAPILEFEPLGGDSSWGCRCRWSSTALWRRQAGLPLHPHGLAAAPRQRAAAVVAPLGGPGLW
eukprot:5069289-Lingulodinium_polyedra.AAC.1